MDELQAVKLAQAQGREVEVESLTTPTRRVVAQPSGKLTAQLSPVPVRVKRDGKWRGLDATLKKGWDGAVRPVAAAVKVDVAKGQARQQMTYAASSPMQLARLEVDGGAWLAYDWASSLPEPTLSGDLALYRDVRPGIDLVAQSTGVGVGTYLVVKTREAAADPFVRNFSYQLRWGGGKLSLDGANLHVQDASGVDVITADQPYMWDSADVDASKRSSTFDVVRDSGAGKRAQVGIALAGDQLRLTPNVALLEDPATVYPVVIDPPSSSRIYDWRSISNQGGIANGGETYVGAEGWEHYPAEVWRTYYKFDTSWLRNARILSASMWTKQTHSPQWECDVPSYGPAVMSGGSGPFDPATLSWGNQPWIASWDASSGLSHGSREFCPGYTRQEFNAYATVTNSIRYGWNWTTFVLASANEGDRDGWRRYINGMASDGSYVGPGLEVSYDFAPWVSDSSVQVVGGTGGSQVYGGVTYVSSDRPTFKVHGQDADAGDSVQGEFIVDGVGNLGTTVTSGGLSMLQWPTPLAQGSHTVAARMWDRPVGLVSGWAAQTTFVVDSVAPQKPAITISVDEIPAGKPFTATFSKAATDNDIARFMIGWDRKPDTVVDTSALNANGSLTTSFLDVGRHTLNVAAVDRAGNIGAPASREIWVSTAGITKVHEYLMTGSVADSVNPSQVMTTTGTLTFPKDVVTRAQSLSLTGSASSPLGVSKNDSYVVSAMINAKSLASPTSFVPILTARGGTVWDVGIEQGWWVLRSGGTVVVTSSQVSTSPQLVLVRVNRSSSSVALHSVELFIDGKDAVGRALIPEPQDVGDSLTLGPTTTAVQYDSLRVLKGLVSGNQMAFLKSGNALDMSSIPPA